MRPHRWPTLACVAAAASLHDQGSTRDLLVLKDIDLMKTVACILPVILCFVACSTASTPPAAAPAVRHEAGSAWNSAAPAPTARVNHAPVYPFEAWRAHQTADVQVTFRTDAHGHVVDVACIDPSDPRFCAATIRALAEWRFEEKSAGPFRLTFHYAVGANGASITWE